MKQSKTTKRLLAVMMSFLMAFSSVQGYIKAEDSEQEINTNQSMDQGNIELDPDFSVDSNAGNTELEDNNEQMIRLR